MSTLLSAWQQERHGSPIKGRGEASLLVGSVTAFFASRQCPGAAIHAAMDWAMLQAKMKATVISGFHSPLERSVLEILLTAKSPAVVVLARDAAQARLPADWTEALQAGRLVVISATQDSHPARLTDARAHQRNDIAASLAQAIVVAHTSPGGQLAKQVQQWREAGRSIQMLV